MTDADPRFPAAAIEITRVYLVDCRTCGAVNLALGDCQTPRQAAAMKAEHLRKHREEGIDDTPDPPDSRWFS